MKSLAWALVATSPCFSTAFMAPRNQEFASPVSLRAAPERLSENVDGVVFVNDKCINCSACANFAPHNFGRAETTTAHIVHKQPDSPEEVLDTRAAMAACPVAAIRVETQAHRHHRQMEPLSSEEEELAKKMAMKPSMNGLDLPFPRKLAEDTWYVGYHNEKSFGAMPYLTKTTVDGQETWIMIDSPRFGKSARDAVEELTGPSGPDYLILTHVDDTADHGKWAEHYPSLKRVFHAGDTGSANWLGDKTLEDVEILLEKAPSQAGKLTRYGLDGGLLSEDTANDSGDVVILHTPGHSPGSISLFHRGTGVLFSGDTLGFTTRSNSLTGFPMYGNDRKLQAETLQLLGEFPWNVVAPGHGHVRKYAADSYADREQEMIDAIVELGAFVTRR